MSDPTEGNKPLKVAILGTAPGYMDAPFGDPSWEIWGLSRTYNSLPRYDRWFELHELEHVCSTWSPGSEVAERAARADYHRWLKTAECPVYLRRPRPDRVPNGVQFPFTELLSRFPRRYFTNTVSWMIAQAISMGAEEVGVWGVDMALSSEYGHQRPSCEYFLGLAEGLGVKVTIPIKSDLLKTRRIYALEDDDAFAKKLSQKRQEAQERQQQAQAQISNAQQVQWMTAGALDMLNYIEKNWE